MIECLCTEGHLNNVEGINDRTICLRNKFEEEEIKLGQSLADIFPYALWLKKEIEEMKNKRRNLEDIGVEVKKCGNFNGNCKICLGDLIEGKTLSENEGKRPH